MDASTSTSLQAIRDAFGFQEGEDACEPRSNVRLDDHVLSDAAHVVADDSAQLTRNLEVTFRIPSGSLGNIAPSTLTETLAAVQRIASNPANAQIVTQVARSSFSPPLSHPRGCTAHEELRGAAMLLFLDAAKDEPNPPRGTGSPVISLKFVGISVPGLGKEPSPEEIRRDEMREWHRRVWAQEAAALNGSGVEEPQFCLALSGGGIRSAAFQIGVLQGLREVHFNNDDPADVNALDYFDIISAASGGSYHSRGTSLSVREDLSPPNRSR